MDANIFDEIAKLFAARRLSRRQALARGGAGLAALATAVTTGDLTAHAATVETGSSAAPAAGEGFAVLAEPALGATAVATPAGTTPAKPITFLFLQSFEAGSLVPRVGSPGHYTLTLKQGLGDTIYFSDRPAKVVGTVPTAQFLKGLGFPSDNPPNAALVGHRDTTHKDVVVVQLFDPKYDASANTLTYEVTLLQDWRKLGETFEETPDDAAHLPRDFTAAHLFIDDCPDLTQCQCPVSNGAFYAGIPGGPYGACWSWSSFACLPCEGSMAALENLCNRTWSKERCRVI